MLRGKPLSESKPGGAVGKGTAPEPPEIDAGDRGVGDEMLLRSGLCGCFNFTLFVDGFAFKSACEFGNESVDIADSPAIPPIFVDSGYEIGKALMGMALDEGGESGRVGEVITVAYVESCFGWSDAEGEVSNVEYVESCFGMFDSVIST